MFKSYIFEFNEPVVTAALYKPFLDLGSKKYYINELISLECQDKKLQVISLKSLIEQLPIECRVSIECLSL